MAHGFRHVPRQRTASEPDSAAAGAFLQEILAGPSEGLTVTPYTHRLVMPATEEQMRAMPPATVTLRDGPP
jgi:hypothetical protein